MDMDKSLIKIMQSSSNLSLLVDRGNYFWYNYRILVCNDPNLRIFLGFDILSKKGAYNLEIDGRKLKIKDEKKIEPLIEKVMETYLMADRPELTPLNVSKELLSLENTKIKGYAVRIRKEGEPVFHEGIQIIDPASFEYLSKISWELRQTFLSPDARTIAMFNEEGFKGLMPFRTYPLSDYKGNIEKLVEISYIKKPKIQKKEKDLPF
jgi:hypothetical protein